MNEELTRAYMGAMAVLDELKAYALRVEELKKLTSSWRIAPPSGHSNVSIDTQVEVVCRGRKLLQDELNEKIKLILITHNFLVLPQNPVPANQENQNENPTQS